MKYLLRYALLLALVARCSDEPKYAYGIEPMKWSEYSKLVTQDSSMALVNLEDILNCEMMDIRYATENNFTGEVVYPSAKCFARRSVAEALKNVEDSLASLELGLILFDAYRPYGATVRFYEIYKDTNYVASPYSGSRHNRGCAVDIGLYSLESGDPLPMPTAYDDFTEEAHQATVSLNREAESNKIILREVMESFGFESYPYEWWHFDFKGWKAYPIMDVSFEELSRCTTPKDVSNR